MTFECTGKGSLSLSAMRALKGRRMAREGDTGSRHQGGLEIFAGELEAVIRELPELEGQVAVACRGNAT